MINRRGQIGKLPPSVIGLGIAAISLVIILVMLQSFREIDNVRKANSASFANETVTDTSLTRSLACNAYTAPQCGTVVIVTNASNGVVIPTTNYTQSNCQLTETQGYFNNTNWNVTYSCTYGDASYITANKTVTGYGTFGDFFTIIVLATIGAIVIGIIFSAFGGFASKR